MLRGIAECPEASSSRSTRRAESCLHGEGLDGKEQMNSIGADHMLKQTTI